eukprot:s929_g15.t1
MLHSSCRATPSHKPRKRNAGTAQGRPGPPPRRKRRWRRGGPGATLPGRAVARGLVEPCAEGLLRDLAVLDHCQHHQQPYHGSREVFTSLGGGLVQELRHLRHRQAKTFQLAMYFMKQNYYDERSTEMMELQEALVSSKLLSAEAAMPQIMKELQAGLQLEEKAHRLLDNQICAVAMFLMMFEALVEREAQLEAAILQQPEVWQLLAQEDLEDQDSTFRSWNHQLGWVYIQNFGRIAMNSLTSALQNLGMAWVQRNPVSCRPRRATRPSTGDSGIPIENSLFKRLV